ncbi:protein hairless [Drosophila santomea]|uniref:protein hairless n=1 Tax=Drosophila santomea TaxID=129105 RepID=UPI0019538F0B|nr:protein hairless [Drosophila santomea]XP_039492639.1 protein hairless [Drosophila santomea]
MTDEHKSNINSNSSNSSNNNNSNNDNNTNDDAASSSNSKNNNTSNESSRSNNNTSSIIAEAAAKFLLKNGLNGSSSSSSFPPLPPPLPANLSRTTTPTPTTTPSSSSFTASNGFLPHAKTPKSSSIMAASAAVAASVVGATASKPTIDILGGVLDYSSLGGAATGSLPTTAAAAAVAAATGTTKIGKGSNSGGSFDMGRTPISTHGNNSWGGYGGRLQFFKDGKFILELARSKDGEKSGWVSVTRKTFRPPSAATSATVTPTSAVTTAYPKNENSTSLSFSDDNSSIQSSPWQRDQPWKQSRPRRGISKELSLFFHRPRNSTLGQAALRTAARKRRRPHEPLSSSENQLPIFATVVKAENGDDTLKAEAAEAVETENIAEAADTSTNEIKIENPEMIKGQDDAERLENEPKTAVSDDSESKTASPAQQVDTKPNDETVEKMNTSEDEEAMTELPRITNAVNGDLNGDLTANIKKPKSKPKAKLSSIIQKLIDGVPARLEQMSKTSAVIASTTTSVERIGGGLSHALTHKVSPPSSATAAGRLVEYHTQHVSPRKRILREFEKVSLEDNGSVNNGSVGASSGGAGGKRSRAKATSTSSPAGKASPMNLAPPQGKPSPSPGSSSSSTSPATLSTQPTRLNSSYSIHSLLGGSSSSSSGKKCSDHPAAIVSNVHHPQHSMYQPSSSSYPRALLTSPKSPDVSGSNGGGGKSPSHAGTKKRSPPYSAGSPVDYGHSYYRDPYAGAGRPSTSGSASQDLSPPRSSPASPATTPRTVPKKTASIRREFASPSASSSSCPSPGDRSASPPERRHMQQQPHLQRSSPLHYYMYPPPPQVNGNGSAGSPNSAPPASNSSAAAVAAAAAAAAAYIPSPSIYNPYISTLAALRHNPLWMHHYQTGAPPLLSPHPQPVSSAAAAAAAAAARLSPQSAYHAFAYNGVGAAVAAAAAAAAFGQPAPSPHTHPHLAHSHQHPHPAALTHHSPAHLATPKLTDSSTDQMSATSSHRTASTSPSNSSASASSSAATSGASSSAMFHTSSLRNEQSSDLPLNLSKH